MKKNNFGTSPAFILFMTFLVLKLTNFIDWSWLWVASPLWLPLPFLLIALLMKGCGKSNKN